MVHLRDLFSVLEYLLMSNFKRKEEMGRTKDEVPGRW